MSVVLLSRDGLSDAIVSTLSFAISARKVGKDVEVIFMGDALNCLCNGVMRWSESLAGLDVRKAISKEAKNLGLPLASPSDPKEIDVRPLLAYAKETGVTLYACPLWSQLLGARGRLAHGLSEIEPSELMEHILSAEKVIGAL